MDPFSVFHWAVFFSIIFLFYKIAQGIAGDKGLISENGAMICQNCGTRGTPRIITKGSLAIEIILWICLIVPGLIYSLWRFTSKFSACPSCGQPGMIHVGTPNGRLLLEKLRTQSAVSDTRDL